MLPEENDISEIDLLTAEYLDATCSVERMQELSKLLQSRKDCREQFVAQVEMHSMLCDYFKTNKAQDTMPVLTENAVHEPMPRRKRRGRTKAA